jgi:hypothetical protein
MISCLTSRFEASGKFPHYRKIRYGGFKFNEIYYRYNGTNLNIRMGLLRLFFAFYYSFSSSIAPSHSASGGASRNVAMRLR